MSRRISTLVEKGAVGMNRSNDILDLAFAYIFKCDVDPVANLIVSARTEAEAACLGQGLQPGRDVDAIAEDIVALDNDVAEIDADAELNALVRRNSLLREAISCCTSIAQRTASTTLANSTRIPSPVVLTMRPDARQFWRRLSRADGP
jgi:hypothetical protein